MRGLPGLTALAALATLASAFPLTTLLRTNGWFRATIAAVAVVAVVGWFGRWRRMPSAVVVGLQLVAGWLAITWLLRIGNGPFGLPGADAPTVTVDLVRNGIATIQRYAAPAPERLGLAFLLTGLVTVIGILVDLLACGRRAPAGAGFPLLVPFLVAAVNTAGSLPWHYFLLAALAWMLLLVREQAASVRALGGRSALRTSLRGADDADAVDAFAWRSRLVAVGLVAVALLVQPLVPMPQTRFLSEGLGRSTAPGGSSGSISFSSDVDITRDLSSRDPAPVLTLRASDLAIGPLAVATAVDYEDGHWVMRDAADTTPLESGADAAPLAEVAGPTTPTKRHTLSVSRSTVAAPQVASVGWPVRLDKPGAVRASDGVVRSDEALTDYRLTYLQPTPRAADLEKVDDAPPPVDLATLLVDLPEDSLVRTTAQRVVSDPQYRYGPAGSPYRKAMALQAYLRDGDFVYSMTLSPTPDDASGRPMDPVSAFLTTKRGYCVQFATSMALMARSVGVPARVRLGFLPGNVDKDGLSTVRRADAHMWPELYLPGTGWTRFEPTPGGRSGVAPAYADTERTRTPVPTTERERSTAPAPSTAASTPAQTTSSGSGLSLPSADQLRSALGWLVSLLALGALLAAAPLAARMTRRRRLREATDPASAVEAQWLSLREQLDDLGVHLRETDTPSVARAAVAQDSSLPPSAREQLSGVLTVVEQARYAPPREESAELPGHELVDQISRTRSAGTRLRALLLPSTGVTALREALGWVIPRRR